MNDPNLELLEQAVTAAPIKNAALADVMKRAREAQERTGFLLEDLAREIAADEAALAQKYERFNAIAGEIIETPERIERQQGV